MSRGSKPGERRGGRQKGTLNKKTVLRNAAINAASANPSLSPLDFLLGLMRSPEVPADLRIKIAEGAAPFVHRRPSKENPRVLQPRKHVGLMKAVHKSKAAQAGAGDPKAGKAGTPTPEWAEEEVSPLEYLLGVMRDPETKPETRIRVARSVVRFVHPRQKRDPKADQAEAELMEALGDEFMVDPELAAKIRDDKRRVEKLRDRISSRLNGPPKQIDIDERAKLEVRIEENATAIGCPLGYGRKERSIDSTVADRFAKRRNYPPPLNRLTETELLLEAQAVARYTAYPLTPEQRALAPIEDRLSRLSYDAFLDPAAREEYQRLRATAPPALQEKYRDLDVPLPEVGPDDPLCDAIRYWRDIQPSDPDLPYGRRDPGNMPHWLTPKDRKTD